MDRISPSDDKKAEATPTAFLTEVLQEKNPTKELSRGFQLKVPQFEKVKHPDGSTTLTDEVGLKLEIMPTLKEGVEEQAKFYSGMMPESLRSSLAAAKIPVYIVNSITDLNPELKGKPLPVEDKRKSWDEVGAAYFDNKTWDMIGQKAVVVTPDYFLALPHEGAHGLDDISGKPSASLEFQKIWSADLQNAREKHQGINPYLAQEGGRGTEETFASVYDALSAVVKSPAQLQTLETFPSVANYISKNFLKPNELH